MYATLWPGHIDAGVCGAGSRAHVHGCVVRLSSLLHLMANPLSHF